MSFEWRSSSYVVDTSQYDEALTDVQWKRQQAKVNHPITMAPDHYGQRRAASVEGLPTTGGQGMRSSVPLTARTTKQRLARSEATRQAAYKAA